MATVQRWTGAETKALRAAMRVSIRAFAAYLGVDARTVNKWEARGATIILLPDTQAVMDTALSRASDEVKTRFADALASSGHQQHTDRFKPARQTASRTIVAVDELNAAAAPQRSTMGDWDIVSEPSSIATIRAMSELFQCADRKLGGGLLYRSVVRYIRLEIAPKLLDPPRDCSSNALFSAAASLTEVAGWMAHDGGLDDRSQRHFNQAYRLAVAADNPVLSANVCASLSHLAIQRGETDDAARISTGGLARATQGEDTSQLVSRLYAMYARAAAMQSQAIECHRALDAAQDALRDCGDQTRVEWIAGFDEASLAGESALCCYSLGDYQNAEQHARKVIELRSVGDRIRSRTFGRLTLANVLLRLGAVDEAARIGSDICLIATSLSSARIRSGLSRLGESLGASRAVPDVAAFLDHLTQMTEKTTVAPSDEARWPL